MHATDRRATGYDGHGSRRGEHESVVIPQSILQPVHPHMRGEHFYLATPDDVHLFTEHKRQQSEKADEIRKQLQQAQPQQNLELLLD